MRHSSRLYFLLLTLFLSACITGTQSPAPYTTYGADQGPGSAGVHNVTAGDTLWSISNRYNISMQDIVHTNNLSAPFALRVGQRVSLPPPQEYRVRAGDSLYTVSRLFNVSTNEVARQNNLFAPYVIRTGQVLKLPSVSRPIQTAQVAQERQTRKPVQISENIAQDTPIDREALPQPQAKPQVRQTSKPKAVKTKAPARATGKFKKPVNGKIISSYGSKTGGYHNDGINIAAARGTPVAAADNGVVVYAGDQIKGSGNLVLVRHDGGWMTAYAHMDSISVTRGQVLKSGQALGKVGSTGSVSSPQLHFEVRRGTNAVNPVKYMGG